MKKVEFCRIIDGVLMEKRFAYLSKTNPDRFGILMALDYQNAKDHLGGNFWIKTMWINSDQDWKQRYDSANTKVIFSEYRTAWLRD